MLSLVNTSVAQLEISDFKIGTDSQTHTLTDVC